MKFLTSLALLAAAAAGPRPVQAATSFDNLFSLISQLEEEALTLQTEYEGKDDEISTLISQITACQTGSTNSSSSSSSSSDEDSTDEDDDMFQPESTLGPQPVPTATPTSGPTYESTSWPTYESTSGPTYESTLFPVAPEGEDVPDGEFTFSRGQSWNYNLAVPVNTTVDVDVVFIDMDAGQAVIDELHENGKRVGCYISIGTVENWREDEDEFPTSAIGRVTSGLANERWIDIGNLEIRDIMTGRVEKAANMSCDAVEPGNMMNYAVEGTGVSVSEVEQIEYNAWFAEEVHAHGMSVGLKNAVGLVSILVDAFDFALNEECHEWNECGVYEDTFLAEGKPVFNVEYNLNTSVCEEANELGLDTIFKDYDLSAPLCSCVDPARDLDCML